MTKHQEQGTALCRWPLGQLQARGSFECRVLVNHLRFGARRQLLRDHGQAEHGHRDSVLSEEVEARLAALTVACRQQ